MALPHRGSWFGLQDFGLTERVSDALGYGRNQQGGSNFRAPLTKFYGPGNQDRNRRYVTQSFNLFVPGRNYQTTTGGGNQGGGGGGGGGGGVGGYTYTGDNGVNFDEMRSGAEDQGQRALEAAIGVFDAKKQGLMNRIPGLQSARDLRIRGLDEGYGQFVDTANREEGKRVGDLQLAQQGIEDQYVGAERKTRASAKALAKQLRNLFAGAGTLDSTQYQDMSIDQSKEITQQFGDLRREKAGKVTSNQAEQEDIKGYYSQQRTAELSRVNLEKDKARSETDSLIQQVLDDTTLTDAQKIEAVVAAQGKLDQRLSDLDMKEADLKAASVKDQQELALKTAQLSSKGYSNSYTQAQSQSKAYEGATTLILQMQDQYDKLTPEMVQEAFTQYGYSPEEAERLSYQFLTENNNDDFENRLRGS